MTYFGMPFGMWTMFAGSFPKQLTVVFGYDVDTAKTITKKAKPKYREIISELPEFEKGDRFKMNLVNCAMIGSFILSMPERPGVERLARTSHKQLATLLLIPGLYRLVPGVFVKSTRSVFGPAAGFDSKEMQVGNGIWRVDMMKCPYHDTCVAYGCHELCCCFCASDDISYTGLHPKLI